MVGYSVGNSGKNVNKEYHLFRERARRTAFSIDEFGPQEIEDYDLESVDFDRTVLEGSDRTDVVVEAEGSARGGRELKELGRE